MRIRRLFAAVALLSMAPTMGFARPIPCAQLCQAGISCDAICTTRFGDYITCDEWGAPCVHAVAAEESEESSRVCSEEHPDAERADTTEA
ncbi:hypothetical protein D7Y15_41685 [Corallococcus sp. AB030]|nr:hypothetical protein D7Y15_41685 [Corallococcus sp. AB030]RUO93086.1 hypothetical protein D7Y11_11405 [Corallococcus sp. AB018]